MAALADRITRHADALERDRRSPLNIALMRGAADSARRDGPVADVFPDGPGGPGSVPAGRLLAALHHREGSLLWIQAVMRIVRQDPPRGTAR